MREAYDLTKPTKLINVLSEVIRANLVLAEGQGNKMQRRNLMPGNLISINRRFLPCCPAQFERGNFRSDAQGKDKT